MIWAIIIGVLFCSTVNEIWRHKELPPRYWAEKLEKEVKHKADSLLDNWAEWERNRDL